MGWDMGVRNWMEIIEDVCVRGLPEVLDDVAGKWEVQLQRIRHVPQSLRDGEETRKQKFDSPAGEAFGARLTTTAKMVEDTEEQLRPVVQMLRDAAAHLRTAKANIPVPVEFLPERRRPRNVDSRRRHHRIGRHPGSLPGPQLGHVPSHHPGFHPGQLPRRHYP